MGAKIRAGDGWSYTLTDEDRLWAGRMAQYEGGSPGDVLWTMTQAYARPPVRRTYPTFAAFIQAYSQPINPIWRRDGSMCAAGGRYAGADNCAERRLAVRDRAASISWGELDADIRAAVSEWFSGSMRNPVPGAVEFAAPNVARSFLDRHGGEIVKQLDNWYLATSESLGWPAGWVTMGSGVPWMALGLAVLAGGGAAVYISRRRRGGLAGLAGTVPEHRRRAEDLLRDAEEQLTFANRRTSDCWSAYQNASMAEAEASWLPTPSNYSYEPGGRPWPRGVPNPDAAMGTLQRRARGMMARAKKCIDLGPR